MTHHCRVKLVSVQGMPHPDECRRMSCTGIEYIGGPPYQGACCTQTKVSSRWVTCVFLKIFLSPVHSQDGSIRAMKLSNACALNLEQLEHLRVCQMFPLQWLKCHPQKRTMYFEIVKVQLLQSGKINGRGEGRGCGVWMGWVVAGGGLKKIYTHSDFFKISASDKVFFNSFELCRFRHTDKYYNAIFFFFKPMYCSCCSSRLSTPRCLRRYWCCDVKQCSHRP